MLDDDKLKLETELMLSDLHLDEIARYKKLKVEKCELTKKSANGKGSLLRPPDRILDMLEDSLFETHKKIFKTFRGGE